jgi:hypothetical protein
MTLIAQEIKNRREMKNEGKTKNCLTQNHKLFELTESFYKETAKLGSPPQP